MTPGAAIPEVGGGGDRGWGRIWPSTLRFEMATWTFLDYDMGHGAFVT